MELLLNELSGDGGDLVYAASGLSNTLCKPQLRCSPTPPSPETALASTEVFTGCFFAHPPLSRFTWSHETGIALTLFGLKNGGFFSSHLHQMGPRGRSALRELLWTPVSPPQAPGTAGAGRGR